MMRTLFLTLAWLVPAAIFSQTGYEISVTLKPYANSKIYLGYYYGKMKALADSAELDAQSKATFKGSKPLEGGIYFVVSPRREIMFEMLIDRQQQFSVSADSGKLPESVKFSGSPENEKFQNYSVIAARIGREINAVNDSFKRAATAADSSAIMARARVLGDMLQRQRDSIVANETGSFLSLLLNGMKEPKVPPASEHPAGRYDSNYAYRYYKSHYWDGISFNDARLIRTPFFEAKLEKYYRELVVPHADSIKKEVDGMLLDSRPSKDMFQFLLVHFVQKYINPQYMGQDAVFVHIFEKYINTGQADFFTPQYREHMTKRAYSLMANLIGQQAADMNMVDTSNKPSPLYKLNADFTVICFWDPTCSHCKEVVPKVDSIYRAKWKSQGVRVYGVKVEGSDQEWKRFIRDHNLLGWAHVHQLASVTEAEQKAGKPGFRQLYDVYQTPILYLLDKDKRIIAKKLTYLQIDEVINLKSKKS
jgi:hypothetical protein